MTQGLALAAAALAQPGDVVLVEQPTYVGFLHQLRAQGLQPIAVPVDADGPLARSGGAAGSAAPHPLLLHHPQLSEPDRLLHGRRRAKHLLLELADRFDFYIIEDDSTAGWPMTRPRHCR